MGGGGVVKGESGNKSSIRGPPSVVFIAAVNKCGGVKTRLPSHTL